MTPHNPRDDLHMPRNGISPLFSGVKVGVGVGIAEMMGQSGDKGRKKDMYIMCRVQCRILTRMNRERMRVFKQSSSPGHKRHFLAQVKRLNNE